MPEKVLKALKTFIKPFEAPQRSVKIKFKLIFISIQLSEMDRKGRANFQGPMFQKVLLCQIWGLDDLLIEFQGFHGWHLWSLYWCEKC